MAQSGVSLKSTSFLGWELRITLERGVIASVDVRLATIGNPMKPEFMLTCRSMAAEEGMGIFDLRAHGKPRVERPSQKGSQIRVALCGPFLKDDHAFGPNNGRRLPSALESQMSCPATSFSMSFGQVS